jgi:hypothetical protein
LTKKYSSGGHGMTFPGASPAWLQAIGTPVQVFQSRCFNPGVSIQVFQSRCFAIPIILEKPGTRKARLMQPGSLALTLDRA